MVADDGGRIPPQNQNCTIARYVISSWDTRNLWMYEAEICQLSHHTCHCMQMEFVKNGDSGSRSAGRAWEEMTGYPAVRNHTNCVDLCNLGKSERKTANHGGVWTTELSIKPRQRTNILWLWSWIFSAGPQECLSPIPNQGRWQVQNHGTGTEFCRSGWQTPQLPYYQATTPIWGDTSSAKQRRLKRGITLPEMTEWRTRVH